MGIDQAETPIVFEIQGKGKDFFLVFVCSLVLKEKGNNYFNRTKEFLLVVLN